MDDFVLEPWNQIEIKVIKTLILTFNLNQTSILWLSVG